MILEGDCVAEMAKLDEASVDAIVCDPPYELAFMGRSWDASGVSYQVETWAEALRVLKPGGHLLAFGGTRTYHRLACAIEDAGFEIRDSLIWLYGSGFPKSLDVSKAIDKAAGVIGHTSSGFNSAGGDLRSNGGDVYRSDHPDYERREAATPEAQQWQGWGTALKPAHEPIVVARKPLIGTVAQNVLEHGTGAINVDGCRIAGEPLRNPLKTDGTRSRKQNKEWTWIPDNTRHGPEEPCEIHGIRRCTICNTPQGRWPANVALSHLPECERVGTRRVSTSDPRRADGSVNASWGTSGIYGGAESDGMNKPRYADPDGTEQVEAWRCAEGCPVAELDRQSGERVSGSRAEGVRSGMGYHGADGDGGPAIEGSRGGCSRFFYVAKASRAERNAGLDGFEEAITDDGRQTPIDNPYLRGETTRRNNHPTVKPIDLMRWLVRLVTPPGGTVLDPFTGSGTTGIAATLDGFDFIGIEREAEYCEIARARIAWWERHPEGMKLVKRLEAEAERKAIADSGQLGLL